MKNTSFLLIWRIIRLMAVTTIFGASITPLEKQMAEKGTKPLGENNPFIMHKFNADPCVLVYNDTVYVYATNDRDGGGWDHHPLLKRRMA